MRNMEETGPYDSVKRQRLDPNLAGSHSSHRALQHHADSPRPLPLHNNQPPPVLQPPNAYRDPPPHSPYTTQHPPGMPGQPPPPPGGYAPSQPPHNAPSRDGRSSIAEQGSAYSRQSSIAGPARSPPESRMTHPPPPIPSPFESAPQHPPPIPSPFEAPEIPQYPAHPNPELMDPSSGYGPSPEGPPHTGYHGMPIANQMHEQHPQHPPHPPPQHTPPTPYGEGEMSHSMSQQSSTYGGSAYSVPHHPGSWNRPFHPQKRSTRAQQACDTCRNRKAKCDEGKPTCSYCRENNQQCVYKEVQPAKADRAQKEIMDTQKEMIDRMQGQQTQIHKLGKRLDDLIDVLKPKLHTTQSNTIKKEEKRTQTSPVTSPAVGRRPSHAKEEPIPVEREALEMRTAAIENKNNFPTQVDHSTGVHRLLRWKSIKTLLNSPSMVYFIGISGNQLSEAFVMEREKARGILRIYGRGQGRDKYEGAPSTPPEDALTPGATEAEPHVVRSPGSSPPAVWGTCLSPPAMVDGRYANNSPDDHPGGLDPDGHLKLDRATVDALLWSYLENIHILHPFLEKSRLKRMVERFYATTHPLEPRPQGVSPHTAYSSTSIGQDPQFRSRKRKLSTGEVPPEYYSESSSAPPPVAEELMERRVSTAIVLLVLALGKICAHKTPLLGPVPDWPSETLPGTTGSTPYSTIESPGSRPTPAHVRSPANTTFVDGRPLGFNQRPSYEFSAKNVDIIPGLAYYARAVELMGALTGGIDLAYVQANLLASLYAAQLASTLESWAWLMQASRNCLLMMSGQPFTEEKQKDPVRVELIYFAYWTCYQFESDILAELDLQPSGIEVFHKNDSSVRFPELFKDPADLVLDRKIPKEDQMMTYYHFQIHMRATLNKIQPLLYPPDAYLAPRNWKQLLSDRHDCRLAIKGWRETLLDGMRWTDGDPPADHILDARLRAKYYGTSYIIHRPLLEYALHNMHVDKVTELKDELLRFRRTQEHKLMAEHYDFREVLSASWDCIEAAQESTTAFDGLIFDRWNKVKTRIIVTNIFGTAHAQFGNMLILSAVYRSHLRFMVDRTVLGNLLDRTITFLNSLAPISTTLGFDAKILEGVARDIDGPPIVPDNLLRTSSSSFSSNV